MRKIITTVTVFLAIASPAAAFSGRTGHSIALDATQSVAHKLQADQVDVTGAQVFSCERLGREQMECGVVVNQSGGHGFYNRILIERKRGLFSTSWVFDSWRHD